VLPINGVTKVINESFVSLGMLTHPTTNLSIPVGPKMLKNCSSYTKIKQFTWILAFKLNI